MRLYISAKQNLCASVSLWLSFSLSFASSVVLYLISSLYPIRRIVMRLYLRCRVFASSRLCGLWVLSHCRQQQTEKLIEMDISTENCYIRAREDFRNHR
jgi:hypothetical protein